MLGESKLLIGCFNNLVGCLTNCHFLGNWVCLLCVEGELLLNLCTFVERLLKQWTNCCINTGQIPFIYGDSSLYNSVAMKKREYFMCVLFLNLTYFINAYCKKSTNFSSSFNTLTHTQRTHLHSSRLYLTHTHITHTHKYTYRYTQSVLILLVQKFICKMANEVRSSGTYV